MENNESYRFFYTGISPDILIFFEITHLISCKKND